MDAIASAVCAVSLLHCIEKVQQIRLFYTTLHHYARDEGSIPFTRSIDYQLLMQLCRKSAGESSLQFNVFLTFRSNFPEFAKHTESGNRT